MTDSNLLQSAALVAPGPSVSSRSCPHGVHCVICPGEYVLTGHWAHVVVPA